MTFEAILDRFNARRSRAGWVARCSGPLHAHGDRHASLQIAEGHDGRTLLHCFTGCDLQDILAAAHLNVSDLFADSWVPRKPKSPLNLAITRQLANLRPRLTPRERVSDVTVLVCTPETLDTTIARGLALAVEGEIVQIVPKEPNTCA